MLQNFVVQNEGGKLEGVTLAVLGTFWARLPEFNNFYSSACELIFAFQRSLNCVCQLSRDFNIALWCPDYDFACLN